MAAIAGVLLTAPRGRRARALGPAVGGGGGLAGAVRRRRPARDVARHDRLLRDPGPPAPALPDRLRRPVAAQQADRVLHPAHPRRRPGAVVRADGRGARAPPRQRSRVDARRDRRRTAGARPRPRGVVAGAAGPRRARLSARAHRRLPPRPAGRRAAGDADLGGGGVAPAVAAGGVADRAGPHRHLRRRAARRAAPAPAGRGGGPRPGRRRRPDLARPTPARWRRSSDELAQITATRRADLRHRPPNRPRHRRRLAALRHHRPPQRDAL